MQVIKSEWIRYEEKRLEEQGAPKKCPHCLLQQTMRTKSEKNSCGNFSPKLYQFRR